MAVLLLLKFIIEAMIKKCILSILFLVTCLPVRAQGNCFTPENLQVSASGNEVSFSWSGTGDADIHAILLWDKNTQQNSKAFTVVGTSFTTADIPNGSYRWRVIALCNTASSQTDHSEWIWGNDFDFSGYCPAPSRANAGPDQLDIPGISTILSAGNPAVGTGAWTIVSGNGGSFGNVSISNSTFTGIAGNTYELRWTVHNECGSSSDDVTVSFAEEKYLNPNLAYGTVTDTDGNQYATIKIGTQTWMAENLRTTKYSDGTSIPNVTDNGVWAALTTGAWSYYNHDASKNYPYGKLYNWYSVNTGKLCPTGWHIPTHDEWTILTTYLGSLSVAGGKMKSVAGWNAPNTAATNESGFSGLPGGARYDYGGGFLGFGNEGRWWSSTQENDSYAFVRSLYYMGSDVSWGYDAKKYALSCRCIKDCPTPVDVNAGPDQHISGTSTVLAAISPATGTGVWSIVSGNGGNLDNVSDANSTFTGIAGSTYVLRWTVSNECGSSSDDVTVSFCSLADAGPDQIDVNGTSTTLAASAPSQGTGTWSIVSGTGGSFSNVTSAISTFTGIAGTTYVLRWTVNNGCGNTSDEVTVRFAINHLNPNLAYGTVTDIDGNQYATIKIGTQTWMAENLRTTKYNDGAAIQNITNSAAWAALTTGAWSYYNHDASRNYPYGKLYNWHAVNTGKLCPVGWRIPSRTDLDQLADHLGGTSLAGGKLKSAEGWNSPNSGATNESGFSGLSAGMRGPGGSFENVGNNGYWWTTTVLGGTNSWLIVLGYDNGRLDNNGLNKLRGLSCRCIKDCPPPSGASAGSGQNIFGTSTTLNATEPPAGGTGVWTKISGTGGSFSNASSATNTFTGLAGMAYTLRWTVTNECGSSSYSEVTVTFCSLADAGSDQIDIYGTSTALTASAPSQGTGSWTIVSGTGGSFGNISSATSTFTGIAGNTYVLRWTVNNICGSNSADVTVSFAENHLNPDLTYGSVTDIDGNQYATIRIGNQTWMAENLRTTKYNDGTSIQNVTVNAEWSGLYTGAWSYYNHDAGRNYPYGKLYNWYAVNTGKLCPAGWRIPSDADFNRLMGYLGGSSEAGGKMKSVIDWNSPNTGASNESGFSGLPGGQRGETGSFASVNIYGIWWSATSWQGMNSSSFGLGFNDGRLSNVGVRRESGFSCRCMKDCPEPSAFIGAEFLEIKGSSVVLAAGQPVESTGMWSVESGSGGSFENIYSASSTFSGIAGESYILRWTVSNECGSAYDEVQVNFVAASLKDIEGNSYTTVQIGSQIWMAENLKVTKYNDGTIIPNVTGNASWSVQNAGAWSYYNNDASYNDPYGKLYNWSAVNTGKLCPAGWRIPTDTDWMKLYNTLGGANVAGGKMKSMASLWMSPNAGATNEAGFSGLPGGARGKNGDFSLMGAMCGLWGFGESNADNGKFAMLSFGSEVSGLGSYDKKSGLSCRCVKDCPEPQAYAGPDQLENPGTAVVLSANIPVTGTGTWYILSGEGGMLDNAYSASGTFSGIAGESYILRWTVSNECGSAYDEVRVSFVPVSVSDIDNNTYNVVKIGYQIWMTENLRTTRYNDGTAIPMVTGNSEWASLNHGGWSYYGNNVTYNNVYGKLYNWHAVNTGKLCPQGWKVPTNEDWTQLINYLGGDDLADEKAKSITGWGVLTGITNVSGFSGLPGGYRHEDGSFGGRGNFGAWWSSVSYNVDNAWFRYLSDDNSSFYSYYYNKKRGLSCRCLKECPAPAGVNAGADQFNIVKTTTTLAASVPGDGKGMWSVVSGTGGSFGNPSSPSSTFTGVAGQTYVLRWTVSNNCGSAYDEMQLNILSTFLTDIEGNAYGIVKIGTQTWMTTNLRTTKYNDGTPIANVTDNIEWKSGSAAWCYQDNTAAYNLIFGKLYNGAVVSTGRLCPKGWHVPTKDEWMQLVDFLGGINVAGGKMKSTASIWQSPNVGADNQSGFSGLPGGIRDDNGVFSSAGMIGAWWAFYDGSIYPVPSGYFLMSVTEAVTYSMSVTVRHGLSCRCIAD